MAEATPGSGASNVNRLRELEVEVAIERLQFSRKTFEQALIFMEHDNKMIEHFAQITGAVAEFARQHPGELLLRSTAAQGDGASAGATALAKDGFWGELWGLIKDVMTGDKRFFIDLIKELK